MRLRQDGFRCIATVMAGVIILYSAQAVNAQRQRGDRNDNDNDQTTIRGTVVEMTGSSLTIRSRDGRQRRFEIGRNADVTFDGWNSRLSDVERGDDVELQVDPRNREALRRIDVRPGDDAQSRDNSQRSSSRSRRDDARFRTDRQRRDRPELDDWQDDRRFGADDYRDRDHGDRDRALRDSRRYDDRYGEGYSNQRSARRIDRGAGLGVQLSETSRQDRGVRVQEVYRDSPADDAGLRRGDFILEFESRRIDSPYELIRQVRRMSPGDEVELTIVRDGRRRTIDAELASVSDALPQRFSDSRFSSDAERDRRDDYYEDRYDRRRSDYRRYDRDYDEEQPYGRYDPRYRGPSPGKEFFDTGKIDLAPH